MSSFSVIIPCYHDEASLATLLGQLRSLPGTSSQGVQGVQGILEIIVVDGADDQKCREVCGQYDARWVPCEPCRGRQLLAGTALARGEALWFLHADARLPPRSDIGDGARSGAECGRRLLSLSFRCAARLACIAAGTGHRPSLPRRRSVWRSGAVHDQAGLCGGRWPFPLALV